MRFLPSKLVPLVDLVAWPLVYPAAFLLKVVRCAGVARMPWCRKALMQVGVFPIHRHYYEPQFDHRSLRRPLSDERPLPGIDWNEAGQLALLNSFQFTPELAGVASVRREPPEFHFNNGTFESGDAEFLYQWVRLRKPRRIIEIGSGYSTLMAARAVRKNQSEDPGYQCRHVCIEPYEMPWLERVGVEVIRRRVEDVGLGVFGELDRGDLLFIDSSHMIRPQGDVLFEFLELLPTLRPGVVVHVHDILSPRDYLPSWVLEEVRFWNEQYLLEAFLTGNRDWRVIGAVNWLKHRHFAALKERCPFLTPDREPGSFYMERVSG
jgi:predicted O-methyltransferase YrrM